MSTTPKPYPNDKGQTHYPGCWSEPRHHNCAVEQIDHLANALRTFVQAETSWLMNAAPDGFDDPLRDAYHKARAALERAGIKR